MEGAAFLLISPWKSVLSVECSHQCGLTSSLPLSQDSVAALPDTEDGLGGEDDAGHSSGDLCVRVSGAAFTSPETPALPKSNVVPMHIPPLSHIFSLTKSKSSAPWVLPMSIP